MRERPQSFKEKVADQDDSSPEISPPVTPLLHKEKYTKVLGERKQNAEEKERKKKEEEERQEAVKSKLETKKVNSLREAVWFSVDVVLKPVEDRMDSVLGETIDPFTDRHYITWLSLVTLAFNYNAWFVTARLCFPYHTEGAVPYWFTLDMLADLIYLTDSIIFQPRKQFLQRGDIINNRVMTKKKYRGSNRFKADTFFEFSDRLESVMMKAYIWRVIRTTGYLLFMLHLNACFYYVASEYQGIGQTQWVYSGLGNAYLRCYYFAVRSLINIGGFNEPQTLFEISFQMANFFIGVFVFSTLIGQMREVIGAAATGQTYFRSTMDNTVVYMVTHHIPTVVQNRVRTWYTHMWDAQGMLDESKLLDKLPLVMRTAIAVDINLATFQKIDLFKGCDQQMLVDMLLRLKSIIYLPGDFVVKKGDIGKEMYIIKSGAVQVVGGADNSVVQVTLKAGCVFGEIRRTLSEILVYYPESQKVLARKARKLMKAKNPAVTNVEEDKKKKSLVPFAAKPPTPKLLRTIEGTTEEESLTR
ncbi:hypothetical protein Q5P01_003226 [Channa striata]|uniref:Cyclic nucleotide-binding domain-containing protein n=1 Tax=Channa striata TaxID=64152 RepID=A0AA88NM51_CHASR|nr:hypothetical protein Q5P01_003226 [Channa striata]